MAYPVPLASVLSGATTWQLKNWRDTELLVPEVSRKSPPLYSYRDIVALRTLARLRTEVSLQSLRKVVANIRTIDLSAHLSTYTLEVRETARGKTVLAFSSDDDRRVDVLKKPLQPEIFTLEQVVGPFVNRNDEDVPPLNRPAQHLELFEERRGGWPTIEGTRIDYDIVAQLVDGDEISYEDVQDYYPGVTAEAAASAVEFDEKVKAVAAA